MHSGAYEGRSVQLRGTAFKSERLGHFLPFYGHILKWGISVVFIANALRRTPRVCVIQHNTSLDEMPPEPVPHQICHHVPPWSKVHLPPPNLLRGLNGCGLLRRPHLYPGLNNSNPYNILLCFVLPFFCFVYVFFKVIPRAVRKRTYVYIRRWRVAIVNCDSRSQRAMEQEREGEIERLRKLQTTTPHRPAKRSRLLEAKLRSKTVSRPPKMTAQLGHFQLLTPRGNPKRVYSTFSSFSGW